MNINPKVIASAFGAALSSGVVAAGIAAGANYATTKLLLIAIGTAFLTGAVTGVVGYIKSSNDWTPTVPIAPASKPASAMDFTSKPPGPVS